MEARDIYTNHMCIGGPVVREELLVVREANGREVIRQGIEPDINGMLGIAWNWHTPRFRTRAQEARHREVAQSLLDHRQYLCSPVSRHDELWMLGDVGKEAITILCECEKVVLLLQPFGNDRRVIRAPAINELFTRVESVVVWTVPARIDGLVDVVPRLRAEKEFLRGPDVAFCGGTYPAVVRDVQPGPGQAEDTFQVIDPRSGIDAIGFSGTHYMLAVLVNPHTEVGIVPLQAMETRDDVRGHLLQ